MNFIGILLAAGTIATLLFAAYVLLRERYLSGKNATTQSTPAQPIKVLPFVAPQPEPAPPTKAAQPTDTFEDYIAAKFDEKYFTPDSSDIATDYALNTKPDLVFIYSDSCHTFRFAVECKFRPSFTNENSIQLAAGQLDSYHFFQDQNGIPVYIILGVGGSSSNPEKLYIIPLNDIPANNTMLPASFLSRYRKFSVKSGFFFHPELKVLR